MLPLAALLRVFARERSARIDQAIELSAAYRGTAFLLGEVIVADDEYTGEHSYGVIALSLEIADEMGLNEDDRRLVEFGALLHDVGKIAVPKAIVNKPGPLDDDEWAVMRQHTIAGQRMLDKVGGSMTDVGQIVRASHERWDGGGYPDGIAGEDVPLPARIVAVADTFHAITTTRPYRRAQTAEAAIKELRACAGRSSTPRSSTRSFGSSRGRRHDAEGVLRAHRGARAPDAAGRARGRGRARPDDERDDELDKALASSSRTCSKRAVDPYRLYRSVKDGGGWACPVQPTGQ